MNLKSVAMASGLVLTFAAGAWLSTIMLASPQRSNREAAVDQAQGQPTAAVRPPRTLPELPASDSILPPLPPLPEAPAAVPPPPPAVAHELRAEPPIVAAQEPSPSPPVEQTVQPPEPPPPAPEPAPPAPPPAPVAVEALPAIPEAPPAMAEAPPPEPQATPVAEVAPPPTVAIPLVPAAEQEPEAGDRSRHRGAQRPGCAVAFGSCAERFAGTVRSAVMPVQQPSPPAPSPRARAVGGAVGSRTIFHDPGRQFPGPRQRGQPCAESRDQGLGSLRGRLDQRQRAGMEGRPGRALPDRSAGGSGIDRTVECGKSSR